jgi:hypothetical protein
VDAVLGPGLGDGLELDVGGFAAEAPVLARMARISSRERKRWAVAREASRAASSRSRMGTWRILRA